MPQFLETWAVGLALVMGRNLPARAVAPVGHALGRVAFAAGVRRRVCFENLHRAFGSEAGPDAQAALARRAYEHLGQSFLEFLRLPCAAAATLRDGLDLTGEEHLRAALGAGRGAIIASGHLGNWEVVGAGLAARGYPVTFVVQKLRNSQVDDLVQGIRRGTGIEVVERGMDLRRAHAALAANRLVFFMCDQDARRRGMFIPLFGIPASTPKGAAQMALRCGAPFLPSFGWRVAPGRFRGDFTPPVDPGSGDEDDQVRVLLTTFNARLEAAVRRAPEQYWWAHRRWKTAPPPAPVPPLGPPALPVA